MRPGPVPDLLLLVGSDAYDGTQTQLPGNTDLHKLLGKSVHHARHVISGQALRHSRTADFTLYLTILNMITDPDQNPKALDNAARMLRGVPARILNHPRAVLATTRDQVARRLAGTPGLHVPKVLRLPRPNPKNVGEQVARGGPDFPLILRRAGTHTGKIVGLIEDTEQLAAASAGERDLLATEFVDFRSPDGLYRKYRLFFIGETIVFRHMIVSDAWNVHARDRQRYMSERPALLAEEEAYFADPTTPFSAALMTTLHEVRQRMELDFFGIDLGLLPDGRALLFEANATMNFFPFLADPRFEYLQRCFAPAREAMLKLVDVRRWSPPLPSVVGRAG